MIEFIELTDEGRRYTTQYVVRLGDVDANGALRFDGVARYLQDVATDDWVDTGTTSSATWVVRRTAIRRRSDARWPSYLDCMTVTTWCGGVGAAWAERRTNFYVDDELLIEVVALWVPISATGQPQRIGRDFFDVYGDAVRERKVSGRLPTPSVDPSATSRPWILRRADLDVVGHINNAAIWQAVTEVTGSSASAVTLTHYGALEEGQSVVLHSTTGALWLSVDGQIQVAAEFSA